MLKRFDWINVPPLCFLRAKFCYTISSVYSGAGVQTQWEDTDSYFWMLPRSLQHIYVPLFILCSLKKKKKEKKRKKILSSCYGVLAVLRKIRHLAPFNVRKQLAKCLVLSKLDYCNTIFHPLHEYQIKRFRSS